MEIFDRDRGLDQDQGQVRGDGHPQQARHSLRSDPVDERDRQKEPSLRKTGTVVEVDHPKRGKYLSVGNPIKMSRQPVRSDALAAAWASTPTRSWSSSAYSKEADRGAARRKSHLKRSTDASARRAAAKRKSPEETPWRTTRPRSADSGQGARAEGRTSLDRPRGQARLRCVRHCRTEGRRGGSAGDAAKLAQRHGLSGRAEDRLARDPAQDRGRRRAGRREERADEVEKAFATIIGNAKKYEAKAKIARRPGAADARGRPGSHHRRGHRSDLRQAGRVRPGRRTGRGAEGHDVPPGAGRPRRRALDARRHRRRRRS